MLALGQIGRPISYQSSSSSIVGKAAEPRISVTGKQHLIVTPEFVSGSYSCAGSRNYSRRQLPHRNGRFAVSPMAAASSSAGSAASIEEPATKVKFSKSINVPGCSSSLSLIGIGYREKVFAIIGVKVYAAGLYVNPHIFDELSSWKGKPPGSIREDRTLFDLIYQSTLEKTLRISLVRDVDGKTFWDALDEAVSPRISSPTSTDESALANFRSIFSGRSLKKGTLVNLTWLEPSKMLVSVPSSDGGATSGDATIESANVTRALFDVFLGESPVSPTLKESVANGLSRALL